MEFWTHIVTFYVLVLVLHTQSAPKWLLVALLGLSVAYWVWILVLLLALDTILRDAIKTRDPSPEQCHNRHLLHPEDPDCGVWSNGACYRGVYTNGRCESVTIPMIWYFIPIGLIGLTLVWIRFVVSS